MAGRSGRNEPGTGDTIWDIHGHPIRMLPEGALFRPDCGTLVVADVHLGKAHAFQMRGIAVPAGDDRRDLARILALTKSCGARSVVIAGDLFHSRWGTTPEVLTGLEEFVSSIGIPLVLVSGNHDRKLATMPSWLDARAAWSGDGWRVVHDPAEATTDGLQLCGHWHPVVRMRSRFPGAIRMKGFLLRENVLVLPAFGGLTGGVRIASVAGDRWFVPLRGRVIELPQEAWK